MLRYYLTIWGCVAVFAIGCGGASSGATNAEKPAPAVGEERATKVEAEFQAEAGSTIEVPVGQPPKSLVIKKLRKGTGAIAKPGDEVKIQYVEALFPTGKVTSVAKHYAPFHVRLGSHGKLLGWEKGIVGMKVGERRELLIPPDLKGDEGTFRSSAVVFLVDLVGIE